MSESLNVLMAFSEGERHVECTLRPDWRVLLDSGAFSNFTSGKDLVTVERYGEYLKRRGHLFWKYFNLDVIADADGSDRNFATLRALGLNPVPIFQRGASAAQLRAMLDAHDVVGIGGVAGRLHKKKHAEYLDQVMAVAEGRAVHVLGCGSEKILAKHRPFSTDSSTYALRNGVVTLWHSGRLHKLQLRGEVLLDGQPSTLQKTLLARMCDEYQIASTDLWKQSFYGRNPARVVNCRSFIRFQRHIRTFYGVEYFIAMLGSDLPHLTAAWELENTVQTPAPVPEPSEETYLVGCGKDKLPGRHPAGELYTGALFRGALGHAQARGRAFILSAEHGLVEPEQELDAYDRTLNVMTAAERAAWGDRVMAQLRERGITRAVALAGSAYLDPLRERGLEVQDPMAGLDIGQRLKWLKENP